MALNYENRHCQIAARILADDAGDPSLLHYKLVEELNSINELCISMGGLLVSHQNGNSSEEARKEWYEKSIIAKAIMEWRNKLIGAQKVLNGAL